jgi:hypothetical protein
MTRFFSWDWRWMGATMAILSQPIAAVPSPAQVVSTVTPPQIPTNLSSTSWGSTQAIDLQPLAGEPPPAAGEVLRLDETFTNLSSENFSEDSMNVSQEALLGDRSETGESSTTLDAPLLQVPNLEDPHAGLRIPPNAAEGLSIQQVFIHLHNPTGNVEQDAALRQQLARTFRVRAGGTFSPLFADQGLNAVRQLPFVEWAEYRVYESNLPGPVIVALLVHQQPEPSVAEREGLPETQQSGGILVSGALQDFPTLYQSDRALVKFILNGGIGTFSDTDPWFDNTANFVAGSYQPTDTITWGEAYLEPGLAGITQVGDHPTYLYGAGSYTLSSTIQPDIFRTDDRFWGDIEQLYGGLLVSEPDHSVSFNFSIGRQKFQLNQGFLFSQFAGSANALDRAASFSNPRIAYEQTVLANLNWGDIRLQGFFLQPDELPVADSETQYIGASLSFNHNHNLEAALTYVAVPRSERVYILPDGRYLSREDLQIINPRLRLSSLFGVPGLWAEGEYAYQFNHPENIAAHGGYIWLGYTAEETPWRPSISYRFAGFSGDNPSTSTYERFDPLQASGLTDWLQGLNLGKVYNNANSFSHRVTFKLQPSNNLEFSLDYYYRFADELNNFGGNPALQTLASTDIGHELVFIGRHYLSENFLLQGVGAIAFPGSAIRQATDDPTHPWLTLQLSLFMFF